MAESPTRIRSRSRISSCLTTSTDRGASTPRCSVARRFGWASRRSSPSRTAGSSSRSAADPADDKPTVILEMPHEPDRVSSFLNIRVADIEAVYSQWSARGARCLTHADRTRDPDPLLHPRPRWPPDRGGPDQPTARFRRSHRIGAEVILPGLDVDRPASPHLGRVHPGQRINRRGRSRR